MVQVLYHAALEIPLQNLTEIEVFIALPEGIEGPDASSWNLSGSNALH